MPLLCTLFGLNWVKEAQGTRTSLEKKYTQQCYGHGWGGHNLMIQNLWSILKPQSDQPGSSPGPPEPRIRRGPGWSGLIRGKYVAHPWWSGVILGGPGSAPDVLKCLRHPGRSGAVREALQSANPALSGYKPCVIRSSSG